MDLADQFPSNTTNPSYLEGQLLVATPLVDGVFARTVVYLCAHDENGAVGVVINRKIDTIDHQRILSHFELEPEETPIEYSIPVYFGGPVDQEKAFILHSTDVQSEDMLHVNNGLAITPNVDMLGDIIKGRGPRKKMLLLGYAGWDAGQLETEMAQNFWITVPISEELVFDTPNEEKWELAAKILGIQDLYKFSGMTGHA